MRRVHFGMTTLVRQSGWEIGAVLLDGIHNNDFRGGAQREPSILIVENIWGLHGNGEGKRSRRTKFL